MLITVGFFRTIFMKCEIWEVNMMNTILYMVPCGLVESYRRFIKHSA